MVVIVRANLVIIRFNYHFNMTKAYLINRFKNHINIGGKKQVAYADAAFVVVFMNSHIVNTTLIMECVILICSIETLSAELTRVFIEFVKSNSLFMTGELQTCSYIKGRSQYYAS